MKIAMKLKDILNINCRVRIGTHVEITTFLKNISFHGKS